MVHVYLEKNISSNGNCLKFDITNVFKILVSLANFFYKLYKLSFLTYVSKIRSVYQNYLYPKPVKRYTICPFKPCLTDIKMKMSPKSFLLIISVPKWNIYKINLLLKFSPLMFSPFIFFLLIFLNFICSPFTSFSLFLINVNLLKSTLSYILP